MKLEATNRRQKSIQEHKRNIQCSVDILKTLRMFCIVILQHQVLLHYYCL